METVLLFWCFKCTLSVAWVAWSRFCFLFALPYKCPGISHRKQEDTTFVFVFLLDCPILIIGGLISFRDASSSFHWMHSRYRVIQCSQSLPQSHLLSLFSPDRSQERRLPLVIEHQIYIKLPTWLKKSYKQTNKKRGRWTCHCSGSWHVSPVSL